MLTRSDIVYLRPKDLLTSPLVSRPAFCCSSTSRLVSACELLNSDVLSGTVSPDFSSCRGHENGHTFIASIHRISSYIFILPCRRVICIWVQVFVVLVKCETANLSWMVNRRFQEFAELNNSVWSSTISTSRSLTKCLCSFRRSSQPCLLFPRKHGFLTW